MSIRSTQQRTKMSATARLESQRVRNIERRDQLAAQEQPALVNDEYEDRGSGPCDLHEGHERPCSVCSHLITLILADVRDDVRAREVISQARKAALSKATPLGAAAGRWRDDYLRRSST